MKPLAGFYTDPRAFSDADHRSMSICGGTTEIQKEIIARGLGL
jgi:alkylation response protein AidB-like acyl-CoA dehydrogenase